MAVSLSSPGIALRIEHPSMHPDAITARLGLVPTSSRPATGAATGRWRSTNYWIHRFRARSDDSVELDVASFLRSLRQHSDALREFRAAGGKLALYLTWSAGRPNGFEFGVETMQEVASLGLDLFLECFGDAAPSDLAAAEPTT